LKVWVVLELSDTLVDIGIKIYQKEEDAQVKFKELKDLKKSEIDIIVIYEDTVKNYSIEDRQGNRYILSIYEDIIE